MRHKGLLGIEHLERAEIEAVLRRAKQFQPAEGESFQRLEVLKGKTVVNLFFEASTRTRTPAWPPSWRVSRQGPARFSPRPLLRALLRNTRKQRADLQNASADRIRLHEHRSIFKMFLCQPTAPPLPLCRTETSVRRRFLSSSRTSHSLPVRIYVGCRMQSTIAGSRN